MRDLPAPLVALVQQSRQTQASAAAATAALKSLDLTSLNDTDTPAVIDALATKADQGALGHVAATCVYPKFLTQTFNATAAKGINRATVINFPSGAGTPEATAKAAREAIKSGANEIDIVLDYKSFQAGDTAAAEALLRACRTACGKDAKMKVILESAAFDNYNDLYAASRLALDCGADFLKTSTGKSAAGGASLEAAATMLQAIKDSGKDCGLKISGGVKNVGDCAQYLDLTARMMGAGWISPARFRFGASGVLDDILHVLKGTPPPAPRANGY
jgi:deoxyribose-phosphate aldolase